MRMWMVNPEILCQKHLCGNHVETHMFLGHLKAKKRVDGYIKNNLFEPSYLKRNHDELASEMIKRGYHHSAYLEYDEDEILSYIGDVYRYHKIDKKEALKELIRRCPECKARFYKIFVLEGRDIKEIFKETY